MTVPTPPLRDDLDAGQPCQQVGHAGGATALDGLAVDDRHVGHQVRQRLLDAGGGDHRFGQTPAARWACAGDRQAAASISAAEKAWAKARAQGRSSARTTGCACTNETRNVMRRNGSSQKPWPASPPASGRNGRRAMTHAQPPRWPVSGLTAQPPSPSQPPVSGRPVAVLTKAVSRDTGCLTVAGAAQAGSVPRHGTSLLLPVEPRRVNHGASTKRGGF